MTLNSWYQLHYHPKIASAHGLHNASCVLISTLLLLHRSWIQMLMWFPLLMPVWSVAWCNINHNIYSQPRHRATIFSFLRLLRSQIIPSRHYIRNYSTYSELPRSQSRNYHAMRTAMKIAIFNRAKNVESSSIWNQTYIPNWMTSSITMVSRQLLYIRHCKHHTAYTWYKPVMPLCILRNQLCVSETDLKCVWHYYFARNNHAYVTRFSPLYKQSMPFIY